MLTLSTDFSHQVRQGRIMVNLKLSMKTKMGQPNCTMDAMSVTTT